MTVLNLSKREKTIEIEKDEKEAIGFIYALEKDFLAYQDEGDARLLIKEWQRLKLFRSRNGLSEGMDRIAPLEDFLKANKVFFSFRRKRKKQEALKYLERLRHDD